MMCLQAKAISNRTELAGQSTPTKRRLNAIKRNKKKLKTLESKIAAMKTQLKDGKDDSSDAEGDNSNSSNAGLPGTGSPKTPPATEV